MIELARELLDNLLVDASGNHLGRIDGVLIELGDGTPPRVSGLETGGAAPARRVHRLLEVAVRWVMGHLGIDPDPARIRPHAIVEIGIDVTVELTADERTEVLRTERWLADHVIKRIPGRKHA